MSRYLAHSPTEERPEGQPLREHLENAAALSAGFCRPFGAEADGYLCGMYHDIGKYSAAFQRRLAGSGERTDHSSAGALELFLHGNIPVSMCIAGHHAGLADIGGRNDLEGSYMARINRARAGELEEYGAWRGELPADIPRGGRSFAGIGNYFYIKMLFSALTDADWLDTEAYFADRSYTPREYSMAALWEKLAAYIAPWKNAREEINLRRTRILEAAIEHGVDTPGLFSMTVPTGGGKTVSSMAFALRHAMAHGMRRIIYVIPYCSILEQTQDVFERIFGAESITAHYSGAEYDYGEDGPDRRAFSAENWESPIILTTAVQFFESLYSAKPGKNRKLHNIARSVIVFDEAQMLPVPFLKPCIAGICRLAEGFGCSAVLCTATQPVIDPLLGSIAPGLTVRELCPEPQRMYEAFRRVTYLDDGLLESGELVSRLRRHPQALCIVNSRRMAQELYGLMAGEDGVFHLSTAMTPYDRKRVLAQIRERLKSGLSCRAVTTSLIEAGVDVDFPTVYRELAGLDSIIQAGGRCNREGKRGREESTVHIFRTGANRPRMLEQNIAAAERALSRGEQADAPETIRGYFDFLLYRLKGEERLDEKQILPRAEKLMFDSVSDSFRLIDNAEYTLYIPTGEGRALAEQLRRDGPSRALLRKLGQYSVGVYPAHFMRLWDSGAVERISETAGILLDMTLYSNETGMPLAREERDTAIFI